MNETQAPHRRTYWSTAPELPPEVFAAWYKPWYDGAMAELEAMG